MARVRFTADFDYRPEPFNGRVLIAYRAGYEGTIPTPAANAAVEAGKAVRVTATPRGARRKTSGDENVGG